MNFSIEKAVYLAFNSNTDSLIPHIAVVTKLKGGNKKEAANSIRKLRKIINPTDVIYPGHGSEVLAQDVNWDFYF
jgi:glyoxylase-like metal-dependent hydrolase (beta-lactamase superfamily II)